MIATAEKMLFSLKGKRVWVAGHRGMVGSAIVRRLGKIECEVLTARPTDSRSHASKEVEDWVAAQKPDVAFLAAAEVGGIHANDSRPADFITITLPSRRRPSRRRVASA